MSELHSTGKGITKTDPLGKRFTKRGDKLRKKERDYPEREKTEREGG